MWTACFAVLFRLALALAALVLSLALPQSVWAQANLENPQNNSFQSGISLISGWKCTAEIITISFDGGPPLQAAYGTARADTQGVCGRSNTGFGLLFNWNLLGTGLHTAFARDNGVEFARATFTVTTLGVEFLQGASSEVTATVAGRSVTLRWSESQQNFMIAGVTGGGGGTYPNVAGSWNVLASFVSENCNFLSVPPDLPTTVNTTLSVTQTGPALVAREGTLILTGELQLNGDFSIVSEPMIRSQSGCTVGIAAGVAGNFLSGRAAVVFVAGRISGICTGISLPCSVSYAGTISRTFGQSATAEGEPIAGTVLQAIMDAFMR